MKTAKIFAAPATIAEVTTINARNIRIGLADFGAHTYCHEVIEDITDAFIDRLAEDSAHAKKGLREIFRRVKGWNEDLQAIIINGNKTHDPDWENVRGLLAEITRDYKNALYVKADFTAVYTFRSALDVFRHADGAEIEVNLAALKKLAPHAYRKNRPLHRCFREFCKAIGIYDDTAGSQFQRLYAQYADEMKSKKIDFKLFVSINPAHFLTMSNPRNDERNRNNTPMLVSCHTLNNGDSSYNVGNAGYARDDVTFIVFTASDPDNPETLNNRKTTRQLFMYKPQGGLLLQSRMYDTYGGTLGAQADSALYRDLIQRAISEGENAVNMWKTTNYDESGFQIQEGYGFKGYCDWLEFSGSTIKISVRSDKAAFYADRRNRYEPFTVGTHGLCVNCGEEIESDIDGHQCLNCSDNRERCAECGKLIDEDEVTWVYDQCGNCVPVCEDCLDSYYRYCDHCCEWHHEDDCTPLADGTCVCNGCLEHCYLCDMCNEWYPNADDIYIVYDGGEERYVCASCRRAYFTQCPSCGKFHRDEDINRESGLCPKCHKRLESQKDENE